MSTLKKQILSKVLKFCAYRERCHQEVRTKLKMLGADEWMAEELVVELIQDNFINEERFAIEFAHSKIRLKSWGKVKTKHELKIREISSRIIDTALSQIGDEEYIQILKSFLLKKMQLLKGNDFEQRYKLTRYAFSKGFEEYLINNVLDDVCAERGRCD